MLPWRRNFHSKRPSEEGGLSAAPRVLPLDEFMYYVMVCEVSHSSNDTFLKSDNDLAECPAD